MNKFYLVDDKRNRITENIVFNRFTIHTPMDSDVFFEKTTIMIQTNNILILSYYSGIPGACQSEWLDDKIDSILSLDKNIVLISAVCSKNINLKNVYHSRIPSLSPVDFLDEIKRLKELGEKIPLSSFLFFPIVFSFGVFIDIAQIALTKGVGEGRWSWSITSFFSSFFLIILKRPSMILTTGGPASAHLAGILAGKIFKIPVIVELQDPLSGESIGRNQQAAGLLFKVESFIVNNANKVVYVTNEAAEYAKKQFRKTNIFATYPGAKNFNISKSLRNNNSKNEIFTLVHLGSLYATRDFKAIIHAIDKLIEKNIIQSDKVKLINLGHVSKEIRSEITKKPYVEIHPPIERIEALKFAADCDVTLLIQNNDDRSKVTIPYKTYDYLNLGNNVLGLLNSDELTTLLSTHGHKAISLSDLDGLENALIDILKSKNHDQLVNSTINPIAQAKQLLSLEEIF